jgi:hypothetical protein
MSKWVTWSCLDVTWHHSNRPRYKLQVNIRSAVYVTRLLKEANESDYETRGLPYVQHGGHLLIGLCFNKADTVVDSFHIKQLQLGCFKWRTDDRCHIQAKQHGTESENWSLFGLRAHAHTDTHKGPFCVTRHICPSRCSKRSFISYKCCW